MKVYIVDWIDFEGGVLRAFTNKQKAIKYMKENEKDAQQMFGISELDFPISKNGILEALEYGAATVYK